MSLRSLVRRRALDLHSVRPELFADPLVPTAPSASTPSPPPPSRRATRSSLTSAKGIKPRSSSPSPAPHRSPSPTRVASPRIATRTRRCWRRIRWREFPSRRCAARACRSHCPNGLLVLRSDIQTRSYSIFTSQEGTWSVSYIADAFCSYPPARQVDGASGRLLKA